ncbi:MAG: DUF4230 domain-containing protein [Bacteroidaceae bacterium]|nr:DUF4230 domain-containing protein [Bacteroidaceae bacterium]MCF0186211.1 DUF4230 domain-containing protein [Bacteroidaceae bacterium]
MTKSFKDTLQSIALITKGVIILLAVGIIIYVVYRVRTAEQPLVELTTDNVEMKLSLSPEQIQSIEDIGEWVFLTVEAEEIVDTVRKKLILSDDKLSRIYIGNLHYGIDMRILRGKDWVNCHGDTISVLLPAVKLIDRKFIDEANTRTFYQDGKWDSQAMKALYAKAQRQMMKHYHTQQTVNKAKENANRELTRFFQSFGFHTVELQFEY